MPRCVFLGAFKFAHTNSASWVCTLVAGSTNCRHGQCLHVGLCDWEDAAQDFHRRPSRP